MNADKIPREHITATSILTMTSLASLSSSNCLRSDVLTVVATIVSSPLVKYFVFFELTHLTMLYWD